ncbi:MAG: hypothetical protein ACJA1W_003572, partial [Akkermansiaceae bacterium]
VEERFEVAFHDLATSFFPPGFHFSDRHEGGSSGPVSVAAFAKADLKDRT